MQRTSTMKVAFLTNFSDSCFRAIPAVAQMADELSVDLILLHAREPRKETMQQAQSGLRSFFPEADRYPGTTRICTAEPLLEAVRRLHHTEALDLIIAPTADTLGFPRLGHRSMRRQMIEELGVPIWTLGRRTMKLGGPTRNVAYSWNSFPDGNECFPQAAEYAWKMGATLHVLASVPDIDEGAIGPMSGLIRPDELEAQIEDIQPLAPVAMKVHIGYGDSARALRDMVKKSQADVLIRPAQQGALNWLVPWRDISHKVPCPVIYVRSGGEQRTWTVHRGAGARLATPVMELPVSFRASRPA